MLYMHITIHCIEMMGDSSACVLPSLRELFDSTGWPGQSSCAVYVFMRPGSANLDAFLCMLSAAAAYPQDVFLLRSEDPGEQANLAAECRERRCRAISFSLASTLKRLPAALLVNRRPGKGELFRQVGGS